MILKVSTLLAVILAGATLVAGCGSSSSNTSQSVSTSNETSVAGSEDVATCKHTIQSQKGLSATDKAKLEQICDRAASGNPATMQQVAHEACVELVNDSQVPKGVSKQEALAICNVVKAK